MSLKIKCDSIEIRPQSGAYVNAYIDGEDIDSILEQIGVVPSVLHFDRENVIDVIGEKECIDEININRVLDIIGIDDCIDHFTEAKLFDRFSDDVEVLDKIGIARVKEYFNLIEKED